MISHVRGTWIVARKEMSEHFISKRFFFVCGFFALSIVLATTIGPRVYNMFPGGNAASVPTLLYFFLSTFQGLTLISLLAVLLSADAVVSEWKDRTLFLLLSKPISRVSMLFGKIAAAYLTVVLVATIGFVIGLIVLMIGVGIPTAEEWGRILGGLGLIALAIMAYVTLGTMFSCLFKSTGTSFAITIVLLFLVFPVIFNIVFFVFFLSAGAQAAASSEFLRYFQLINPSSLLSSASSVMAGDLQAGGIRVGAGGDPAGFVAATIIAIGLHVFVYTFVSWTVVRKRDYA